MKTPDDKRGTDCRATRSPYTYTQNKVTHLSHTYIGLYILFPLQIILVVGGHVAAIIVTNPLNYCNSTITNLMGCNTL